MFVNPSGRGQEAHTNKYTTLVNRWPCLVSSKLTCLCACACVFALCIAMDTAIDCKSDDCVDADRCAKGEAYFAQTTSPNHFKNIHTHIILLLSLCGRNATGSPQVDASQRIPRKMYVHLREVGGCLQFQCPPFPKLQD